MCKTGKKIYVSEHKTENYLMTIALMSNSSVGYKTYSCKIIMLHMYCKCLIIS